jgi:hypothetical protein
MESPTDALMDRVSRFLPATDAQPEWGSASLSTTPTSLALRDLAGRVEALENAVLEIAAEVQQLATRSTPAS